MQTLQILAEAFPKRLLLNFFQLKNSEENEAILDSDYDL